MYPIFSQILVGHRFDFESNNYIIVGEICIIFAMKVTK